MKVVISLFGLVLTVIAAGCGSSETSNSSNSANTNGANGIQNVNANELPPGLSASPMVPISNANAVNSVRPGSTPTPGIPDPKTLGKPAKPGATPTPGIPDEATIKKQMEQMRRAMNANVNSASSSPSGARDGQPVRKKRNANN